ncbi:MAG: hypothetical protein GYA23_04015, partial [Methanomicrobiales archaeon]|nr:hypothetical protein [Methanomicrobiales archaeon]
THISNITQFRSSSGEPVHTLFGQESITHNNAIGFVASFPSERIYYPLIPTSAYGDRQVPVILYVNSFVTPQLYDSIRHDTEVVYFTDGHSTPDEKLAFFYNGRSQMPDQKYTKIRITAPSGQFTEDLWIDPTPPPEIRLFEWYLDNRMLPSVISYIIFSLIASLAAGFIVFRKQNPSSRTLLLHGLWNCTTFIGFVIMTRRNFPQEMYGKRVPFVIAFYGIFGLLLSAWTIALAPSLALAVLGGWILTLLSPLLSLLLILVGLMIASGVASSDLSAMMLGGMLAILCFILAFAPVPVLIWLRRWIDPETGLQEAKRTEPESPGPSP